MSMAMAGASGFGDSGTLFSLLQMLFFNFDFESEFWAWYGLKN
jgi:hypothetical protein